METKYFEISDMMLTPAAPGTCPECATAHEAELPHNVNSLFYRYKFYQQHGRWPNFEDASAHCTPQIIDAWRKAEAQVREEVGSHGDG